jgi:CheY-like chemotaxis protein
MESALKIKKNLIFIFMTGYSEISEKDLIFGGAHRVLHKPFGKKELMQILNEEADKLALN